MEVAFASMPGAASCVACGDRNNVWTTSGFGMLWKRRDEGDDQYSWFHTKGNFLQMSVGGDGAIWGLLKDGTVQKFEYDLNDKEEDEILRIREGEYKTVMGNLSQLKVVNKDCVWGVNEKYQVFSLEGTQLKRQKNCPPSKYVGAAPDGAVAIVSCDGEVLLRKPGSADFTVLPAPTEDGNTVLFKSCAVRNGSSVFAISATSKEEIISFTTDDEERKLLKNGTVWVWSEELGFSKVENAPLMLLLDIGADGIVWGVNTDDELFAGQAK